MTLRLFSYAGETLKLEPEKRISINQGEKMQTGQGRKRSHRPATQPVRAEFTAAVRYLDGRCELFRVRNAVDEEDARAVVLSELDEVASVLAASRG
jgi:hypothetical protein